MHPLTLQPAGMPVSLTSSEGIRLLGLPAEKSAQKELSGSADEIVKTIAFLLNQMVMAAIDKRTAQEFTDAKHVVFPQYVQLVLSFATIVSTIVPKATL